MSLSNRSSRHLKDICGMVGCKHNVEEDISHIPMKCALLCIRCKHGMSRIPMAVLQCEDSYVSVKSEYSEMTRMESAGLYISLVFREAFHSRSQLRTLLEYAEINHPSSWDDLFGKNKCWLNLQNAHGYSALHYACLYDCNKAAEKLIQSGIDITLEDYLGNQALHIACSHSNASIVETLLNHMGANCFKKNRKKMTALEIAIRENRVDVVHKLISHMHPHMKHHPLCVILNDGCEKLVKQLLKEISFDTYFCKAHDLPLLILALVNEPHTETERLCLRFWSRLLLREQKSNKILATLLEHIESLSEESKRLWITGLVKFKKYKNQHGNTLLHYSCWYNAIGMTKLLLELETDLSPNQDGHTPLHLSCIGGHFEVTKLLVDKGLQANTRNKANLCPLSLSCTKGNLQIVTLLLKSGFLPNSACDDCKHSVDSFSVSKRQFLPINKAVRHLPEAVPLLLQYGAYINFNSLVDDMDTVPHMSLIKNISEEMQSPFRLFHIAVSDYRNPHYEKSLCHMIRAGALIRKERKFMQDIIFFEREICNQNDMELIELLVESGYRFSIHLEIPEYLQHIQSNPYSLQCISGHRIRTNLRPNAWVGVKYLGLPTQMKKFVVLDSAFVCLI